MASNSLPHPSRRDVMAGAAVLAAAQIGAARLVSPARAGAAHLGLSQPAHYRFKLGDFEVTTISDSNAFIDGPWPLIGNNATEADVARLMRDNLLPTTKYQPGFTPVVINTGAQLILFDAGNGERGFVPRPAGGWLAAQLAPAGFKREDIDLVILSHGHPDHIGGLRDSGQLLFPNARYAIAAGEYDFWSAEKEHTGDLETFSALFRDYVVPLAEQITFLKPGDEVVPGIRAVASYGHTPGHLSFQIESAGQELFVLGDLAHHHVASLARPDWHCVFDVDPEAGANTRKRTFDMLATDRVPVCAYHMPFPSIGYVTRQHGGGYRWLPHSYQLNL